MRLLKKVNGLITTTLYHLSFFQNPKPLKGLKYTNGSKAPLEVWG